MKRPRKSLVLLTVVLVITWCTHYLIWGGDIDPPDTSDMLPPQERVPDEENAYFPLDEAFQLLQMTWEEGSALDEHLKGKKRLSAEALDDLLARNQAALGRLPAALERPRLRVPPESLGSGKPSFLSSSLNVLRLLRAKTRLAMETSSLDAAVTGCVLRIRFAERMVLQGRDGTLLIAGMLFGHGETHKDMRTICHQPSATPAQLNALAVAMDQTGDRSASIRLTLQYEYLFFAHLVDRISNGAVDIHTLGQMGPGKLIPLPDWTPLFSYVFKPNYTKLAVADSTRMVIRQIGLNYASRNQSEDAWIAFRRERFNLESLWTKNNIVGAMISLVCPVFGAPFVFLDRECALKCDAAGTRIMLACRLFELEKGRMPEKLEELVPELLPAVPADPFDGKPMRYDAGRKVIYAVGPDLIDSGGSTNKVEKSVEGWTGEPWNRDDIVYPVGLER